MSYANPGPAQNGAVNLAGAVYPAWVGSNSKTALIGPDGSSVSVGGSSSGGVFNISVTASPGASQDNYAPTGYVAGTTNRLLLAANAGGTTLTGLLAATDGWSVYVRNTSATDTITFAHLSGSSSAANQFSCPQGVNAALQPLTGSLLIYVVNQWVFA